MLFGPDGSLLLPGASHDVDRGVEFLCAEVAKGVTTFFLGRGSVGFALLVASPKRFDMGAGVAIGVQLSTVNLAKLRNECLELLGEREEDESTRLHAAGSIVGTTAPGGVIPRISGAADDVDSGFRYLSEEVGAGRTAFFLGQGGPTGYILLVGSPKCFDVGRGIGIGVGLSEAGLRLLRSRVVELLHGRRAAESFGKV